MILVKPSTEILGFYADDLASIERIGRTCYKSEDKITSDSAEKFIKNILKNGHESVIEHSALTVKFIVDRGVSHELVRHRLCAFSQESTRYCNYKGGVTFVIPPWLELPPCELVEDQIFSEETHPLWIPWNESSARGRWLRCISECEFAYHWLLKYGQTPQQARSVLPNSLKTEIVVTANFREWRHMFKLRCSPAAHPQMREVMIPLLEKVKEHIPIIFDDL